MKWYVDKKPKSCKECPCYQELDEPITYGEPSWHGRLASGQYITHTCGIENCADMDGINNCPLMEISDSQDEINKLSKERYEYKNLCTELRNKIFALERQIVILERALKNRVKKHYGYCWYLKSNGNGCDCDYKDNCKVYQEEIKQAEQELENEKE